MTSLQLFLSQYPEVESLIDSLVRREASARRMAENTLRRELGLLPLGITLRPLTVTTAQRDEARQEGWDEDVNLDGIQEAITRGRSVRSVQSES